MTDVQKIGAEIAYRIRAELVCCHIFDELEDARETMSDTDFSEFLASQGHDICYWGEAAARLAEEHHLLTEEEKFGKV